MDFICSSDKGAMFAYCKVCNVHVNVSFGGKYDVVRHSRSASHGTLKNATKTQPQMKSFFVTSKTTELSTNVLTADVKFAQFVAKHNLPFSVDDHFTKLVKQLFPDSDIAGKFTSGLMKTTMIVTKALAPRLDDNVVHLCQNHTFLLLTDKDGCICHLANLCCVCAVKQLPMPVEELLIDVYFHFNHMAQTQRRISRVSGVL